MNTSILTAIESICNDIAANANADADGNRKRAEVVTSLTFCGLFVPDEINGNEYEDEHKEPQQDKPHFPSVPKNTPAAGEHFKYHDMEFVALGIEQGGLLAVAAETLEDEMPFDEDNCNDWRKSTLRRYLNEEYIKNFDKAGLLPLVSDLTTDSGQTDYGTSEDYIAVLSCDLYRKYREYVPKYNNWVWTLTPWHISPSLAHNARIVITDGSLGTSLAYDCYGVAPACLFNPSIFE